MIFNSTFQQKENIEMKLVSIAIGLFFLSVGFFLGWLQAVFFYAFVGFMFFIDISESHPYQANAGVILWWYYYLLKNVWED